MHLHTFRISRIVLYSSVLKRLTAITIAVPPQVNRRTAHPGIAQGLYEVTPHRNGLHTAMNEQNLWTFT